MRARDVQMDKTEIRYDDRAILITGSGRGLGRVHALLLASRGAKVVVADNGVSQDGSDPGAGPAQSVVAEIKAAGGQAVACTADLSTGDGAIQAVQASLDAFGRIDAIIHNASTCPDLAPVDEMSSRDIEILIRINPLAGAWMIRAAWPHMVKQHYGRIVLTTSAGFYGSFGTVPYATAKAAYMGMTRTLAVEGRPHGICVNAISPCARTRMTERFEPSEYTEWFLKTMPPEKVSVAVAYLVSDECQINGETFNIGGGRIARLTFAEADGIIGTGASIEEVRDMMPAVMADETFFYPKDLAEWSGKINDLFGFKGSSEAAEPFAVRPMTEA
jgi:NAD(P)-dependent dehydrogenase (short-subunit alcohol dehydrogenase family)